MPRTKLPAPVTDDLFCTSVRHPDMAMAHVGDQLERMGFTIEDQAASRQFLTIRLSLQHGGAAVAAATVVVVRQAGLFTAEATAPGGVYLPVTGSWPDVVRYLRSVKRACLPEGSGK